MRAEFPERLNHYRYQGDFTHRDFFGVNSAPHFGHFILSKSIRWISLGAIE
jgi:hypothetical protein